ncbi:MAG: hypothetical protein L6R37_007937 [Teloschistes peruensis]|nr:MAG: hypothetical protein L6R37_007937 [Teloschistes peruensis]
MLPEQVFGELVFSEDNEQLAVKNPRKLFYGLVPSAFAAKAISLLEPQSIAAISTPGGSPVWSDSVYNNRRAYWLSLEDSYIPAAVQEDMLHRSRAQ